MDESLQQHWDQRYQNRIEPPATPPLLLEFAHLLPQSGQALELACGLGAASLFLARQGLNVEAWDLSASAIAQLHSWADAEALPLKARTRDLSTTALPEAQFDLILVSRFLDRTLFPQLVAALKPEGLLFYQTFTALKARPGGPRNRDYLLQPGELLQLTRGLNPVYYREEGAIGDTRLGMRNMAYLIAQQPR